MNSVISMPIATNVRLTNDWDDWNWSEEEELFSTSLLALKHDDIFAWNFSKICYCDPSQKQWWYFELTITTTCIIFFSSSTLAFKTPSASKKRNTLKAQRTARGGQGKGPGMEGRRRRGGRRGGSPPNKNKNANYISPPAPAPPAHSIGFCSQNWWRGSALALDFHHPLIPCILTKLWLRDGGVNDFRPHPHDSYHKRQLENTYVYS